jgi:hypothetical protein
MRRQDQDLRQMQNLMHAAAPFHVQMMVKMEQISEWRQDAELSRASMVARRQAAREKASARQRLWERLQAPFQPVRQAEPAPC